MTKAELKEIETRLLEGGMDCEHSMMREFCPNCDTSYWESSDIIKLLSHIKDLDAEIDNLKFTIEDHLYSW